MPSISYYFVGGMLDSQTKSVDGVITAYYCFNELYYRMDFHGQPIFRYEELSVDAAECLLASRAVQLSLVQLSVFNTRRSDIIWPQGRDWTRNDWVLACFSKLGEAANISKKMLCEGYTHEMLHDFHKEMVDLLNYCDLTISMTGGDTEAICRENWNEVSDRNVYPVRL